MDSHGCNVQSISQTRKLCSEETYIPYGSTYLLRYSEDGDYLCRLGGPKYFLRRNVDP